ncbi:MAG: hypothetical protein ABIK85_00090, partial [Candidatus Eisenbacteria bacterium]
MTNRMLLAVLVCLLTATVAFAQGPISIDYRDVAEMPTGIEGERVQMLFDAVNTGDEALVVRFYNESFSDELKAELPLEWFVGFFGKFVRNAGAIDFHSVRLYDPRREDATVIIFRD